MSSPRQPLTAEELSRLLSEISTPKPSLQSLFESPGRSGSFPAVSSLRSSPNDGALTAESLDAMRLIFTTEMVRPPRFVESRALVVDAGEDWSKVRSPGRARRRRLQGHRQNISRRYEPSPDGFQVEGTVFAHPATLARWRRELRAQIDASTDSAIFFGGVQI